MYKEFPIPYCGSRNPRCLSADTFSETGELAKGINCELLVDLLTGISCYQASDFYEDPERILYMLDMNEDLPQQGDIIGLWSVVHPNDIRYIHVGILLTSSDGFELLHASQKQKCINRIPLIEVMRDYGGIAFIKRPMQNKQMQVEEFLKLLDLE